MRSWPRVGLLAALLTASTVLGAEGAPAVAAGKRKEGAESPAGLEGRVFRLPDSERTRLAARKRDESIEGLKRIIPSIDDATPQKAEMLYRLSELYWEKSQYLAFTAMEAHDKALLAHDEAIARGEKVTAPKPDLAESQQVRAETLRLYRLILAEYPDYPRRDEVLFNLALNLYDLGERPKALKVYRELIQTFPDSQFAGDAWVQVGNHHFDVSKDVIEARKAYEAASRSKDPRIFTFATYRLAWCDFNIGEYRAGLKKLQHVVELVDGRSDPGARHLVDLKTEALNDSVRFFVQLDAAKEGMTYYRKKAGRTRGPILFQRLAAGLAEAGFHDSAIGVYRTLTRELPLGPKAPEYQQGIVNSYEKLRQRDKVREELARLATGYGPGSRWWKANANDPAVLRNAFNVTEDAMRGTVTDYHREAQKTHQVETYRIARDIYRQYVEMFASGSDPQFISDHAFNLRFYYAEILWALEEWEAAAEQYRQVVSFVIPDRELAREISNPAYRQTAAYGAVLAYEKLVRIERGLAAHSKLRGSDKVDEGKKKPGVESTRRIEKDGQKALAAARPLTDAEARLVGACDAYNQLFPGNDDELDVRYQAAVLHYEANQMEEAIRRFGDIIARFPADRRSQDAADLSMDILNNRKEWLALNKLGREFLANKKLWKPRTPFAERLAKVVEGSQYKYVDEVVYRQEKDPARAARMFMAFVDEFPDSENADRALTYVMFIAQEADELDRAVAAGERVLKDYRGSAFEPKVRYTLAGLYGKLADFGKSARMYEAFLATTDALSGIGPDGRALPEKKRRPVPQRALKTVSAEERESLLREAWAWRADAQYNAGMWWEGMGEHKRAIAAFEAYQERFRDKEDVPEVALRVAAIHERDGRWAEALRALEDHARRFSRDKRASAADHYLVLSRRQLASEKLSRTRDAEQLNADLLRGYSRLSEEARKDPLVQSAYARARFTALEPMWKEYTSISLDRPATMVRDLKAKQKKLPELAKAYTEVLSLGVGEWGIAALTRIGMAYADLAEKILASPDPGNLDEEQRMLYRTELENVALPLEDECVTALETALAKAYELTIYNDWTLAAQDKVNQYRRGSYEARREVPLRRSDFFASSPLLKEAGLSPASAPDQKGGAQPAQGATGAGVVQGAAGLDGSAQGGVR